MRNIQEFWKKQWVGIALLLVSGLFLYQYLFLYRTLFTTNFQSAAESVTLIFNQPDEMANYAFIKEWVLRGQVGIVEPLTELSQSQVHPRSMTVVDGRLVPIGFPGFIAIVTSFVQPLVWLFGAGAFNWAVILFTPLLAASSSILLYGISRSLGLAKTGALVSGIGLLLLPSWWYYASRPLQTNTVFVFFILAGLWSALRKNNRASRFLLTGLSFGLALYIRPSEWVWVFGLIGALGYFNREFLGVKNILFFGLGSGLMAVIFFLTQFAFYGSWLGSGYVRPAVDGSAGLLTAGPQGIYWLKAIFLPFGFDLLAILKTLYYYGVKLFLPFFVAVVIGGGFVFVHRKNDSLLWQYLGGLCLLGIWLLTYYGSWQFADNLAGQVSIGSSQVRYFLPLYVLSIPLLGYLFEKMWAWKWAGKLTVALIGLALCGASIKSVYFKFEGLVHVKQTVQQYYEWREKIISLTPEHAIIITRYADKYLFPERKIIATVETAEGQAAIKTLVAAGQSVYWYDVTTNNPPIALDKPIASWENLELRQIKLIK